MTKRIGINDEKRDRLFARYMKMFEPMYDIHLCRADEIDDVTDFIDNYWKRGHALTKSRRLMDWQHYDSVADIYHFVLARFRQTGEIHAIEGFIPTSQFDPAIKTPMTWGAIWKTRDDVAPAGLGVVVKQYREHQCPSAYAMEVGISPDAVKYNKRLGNTIFELEPWYIQNPDMTEFRLLEPDAAAMPQALEMSAGITTAEINADQWEVLRGSFASAAIPPFKSHSYYYNRYFAHPLYKYEALILEDSATESREALFYRVVRAEGREAIFIVDYIGDGTLLSRAALPLRELLRRREAEYMLFLNAGISAQFLLSAGFRDRRLDKATVPVYYEPFLKANIDIYCTTHGQPLPWITCKGDADQDRPNLL